MKCSFCDNKVRKWEEGWVSVKLKEASKKVFKVVGCPDHNDKAWKEARKAIRKQ